jgi:hypothetical protein
VFPFEVGSKKKNRCHEVLLSLTAEEASVRHHQVVLQPAVQEVSKNMEDYGVSGETGARREVAIPPN